MGLVDIKVQQSEDLARKHQRICVNNSAILSDAMKNLKRYLHILKKNFEVFEKEEEKSMGEVN